MTGQIDRKDAPRARHVADSQNAIVDFDAAAANVETKAEARSILAALSEGKQRRALLLEGWSRIRLITARHGILKHGVHMNRGNRIDVT